jgi:hypothetical protein
MRESAFRFRPASPEAGYDRMFPARVNGGVKKPVFLAAAQFAPQA